MKPLVLAVTPGDPDGIGPEVVSKTLKKYEAARRTSVRFLCVGAIEPFLKLRFPFQPVSLAQVQGNTLDWNSGRIFFLAAPSIHDKKANPGFQSGWSIETATQLVLSGICNALVTGPISKERLQKGGYLFSGHTDFLATLCKSNETMMLANNQLRVSLVTVHLSLHSVSKQLTRAKIRKTAENTLFALKNWWGISKPKIAVLALNPHAGEAGLFGDEEKKVIQPEILALSQKYKNQAVFQGPFPADTFFALENMRAKKDRFDAVIAMYHDQGLIPVKLLDFSNTVNITLGLPMIRTSVDHGVAFDIAGQNRADSSSFKAATDLAIQLVKIRHKGTL